MSYGFDDVFVVGSYLFYLDVSQREGFGYGVSGNSFFVFQGENGWRGGLIVGQGVVERVVDFVGEDNDVFFFCERNDVFKDRFGGGVIYGIVGIVEDDYLVRVSMGWY